MSALSALAQTTVKAGLMPKTVSQRMLSEAEIEVHIGRAIRKRRRTIGIPQKTAAGLIGVSHQQWQKYEAASQRISASRLASVAQALSCRVSDLYPCEVR